MPVDTRHPEYWRHEQKAQRVRDAVAGSDAIKAKGFTYLPHPQDAFPTLTGEAKKIAEQRYAAYKKRAVWLGATKRTHDGLLGAVFRKTPTVDLPGSIDYMEGDADGSGTSLIQFAKVSVSKIIEGGREGILVDYPEADDGLTKEQAQGLAATLRHYDSESIINWRVEGENLTLIVLAETYETEIDEFDRTWDWQYRVLRLEDGTYTQQVYRDGQPAGEKVEPRKGNGQRWERIPFAWVGALTNDEQADSPLLLDIANLNIAHYQNSAALEEMLAIIGQGMVHVDSGDMNTQDWKEANPNGINWGSRDGIQTKNGRVEIVQAEERSMLSSEMDKKEQRMLSLGARLLTGGGQNETAEAVRARSGAETANLATVAHNVSDAITQCLQWAQEFQGGSGEIEFELSQEFYPEDVDPQMLMARMQELEQGVIALKDYRDWRRRTGGIDPKRSDEDIDAEIQTGGLTL